jgi:hypothetical protein
MNIMNEVINVANELNNELYKLDSYHSSVFDFLFSMSTDGHSYAIIINEVQDFGFSITLYNDDEPFNEDIETMYENDEISFRNAVKTQVLRNLNTITMRLEKICKELNNKGD